MIKFTITINLLSLKQLKDGYRNYYGYKSSTKVTKKDIAIWLGSMAESDAMDY